MDSISAFARCRAARGQPIKVFDWDRAAEIIRRREARNAAAGLGMDWEYTGGPILRDGQPVPREDTYTYLASDWATPELDVDGDLMECWKYQKDTPGWDSGTYWPESALAILGSRT